MIRNILTFPQKRFFLLEILFLISVILSPAQASAAAPTSGLVGYWNFDEGSGTSVGDSSGNNNTGNVTGASWTVGKYGQALNYNGPAGNYLNLGNPASLNISGNITVSAWVKFSTNQINTPIVARWGIDESYLLTVDYITANGLKFCIRVSNINKCAGSVNTYGDNNWHHVAGVFNGSNVLLYVDGNKEVITGDVTGGPIDAPGQNVYMGCYNNGTSCFTGQIDEVRIYNRPLSAQEVIDVYNDTGGSISPSPSPTPTPTSSPTPTPTPPLSTTWYVRQSCANNGDGTTSSCASTTGVAGAWKGFSNVVWSSIKPGHTLYLVAGEIYAGGMRIGASGNSTAPITISVYGSGTAILDDSVTNGAVGFHLNGQSYITIDGVRGNAVAGDTNYGIKIINLAGGAGGVYENTSPAGTNIKILHLDISGTQTTFGSDDQGGIRITSGGNYYEAGYNWIHGLIADPPTSRWDVSGIEIWNAESGSGYTNVLLHDNLVENLGEDGIKTSNNASIYNNIVRKVYKSGNHSDSLLIQNGNHARIYNNLVNNSLQQCIYLDDTASGVTKGDYWIYNNIINCPQGSSSLNIDPEGVPGQNNGQINGVHILNNLFNGSAAYVIRGNGRGGTSFVHNLEIKNNIFFSSTGGLLPVTLSSDNTFIDANAFDYNIYAGFSASSPIVAWSDGSNKTLAQMQVLGRELHGQVGTPSFVNYASSDFHLTLADVFAVNKGVNLSGYFNTDKDSNPRPSSAPWDIGAYTSSASGGSVPPALPPPPTPIPGDLNLDHTINFLDFSLLNSKWLQSFSAFDLLVDGLINSLDFAIMSSNWLKTW